MDVRQFAAAWEENQEYLKQCLGRSTVSRYGARWVLMPQVPAAKFNHVSCVRVHPGQVDELIADARGFFQQERVPGCAFLVTPATEPEDFSARLTRLGFTFELNPVMIWDKTPVSAPPHVLVQRADDAQREQVYELLRRVFFPSATPDTLAMARSGVDRSFELGAINYIAYVNGRRAGLGMLFMRGRMAGIYNMCTMPEHRGRGVATAIIAACIADAERHGCRWVGLTPTVMGRPLYEKLGFREVYQEQYFAERF